MKKLNKKTIEILENNGFNVGEITKQNGEYYIEMGQYTPAGEDWWETIWFDGTDDGLFKAVEERWDSFNADDEAAIWIESRGKNGVPNSIRILLDDAEWKEKKLEAVYRDLLVA